MKMYSAKYFNLLIIISLLSFSLHQSAFSQTYQVNGTAVDKGNGLVRLTTAQNSVPQTAAAWNTVKLDLTQPFDMSFDLFFGCNSGPNGGDGMTFTLQNDPRGLTALGDGSGHLGIDDGGGLAHIEPAISIEFDTYDGTAAGGANEIPSDHIAVDLNGNVNNGQSFLGAFGTMVTVQPADTLDGGRDLEDCSVNANNFYSIRIVWNPGTQQLQLYEEGKLSLTYTSDLISRLGSSVYWGFTGATGSASNEQWIAPKGSIIPWECTAATSCCTPFTVTPSSPTTICNNPITLSVSGTYNSYYWSDGTTSSTLQVTAPGTYTLNVQQTQGGNLCPGSATFTITPTGPTASLSGGSTLCNSSQTTPLSVALTGTPPWSLIYATDGVNQPAITNITSSPYVFQANGAHVYSLVSVADNSGCNSSATGTATVSLYPGIPVGHDDFFTAPGTANLSVDNNGGTYVWYDDSTGNNVVFTGDAYTTPVLNGTTTYYVENTAVTAYIPKSVAMHDETSGDNPNRTDDAKGLPPAVCFLDFSANSSFLFDTLTCAVNSTGMGTGQVTVYITSYTTPGPFAGAETLVKDSINIPVTGSGLQKIKIPLHYSCTAGTNYHISYNAAGVLQTEMYWQFMQPTSFPITKDPQLTIQQYGAPNTRYPGLFDWKIRVQAPSASCGRTPVTAYTCPQAHLSGDAVICNDGSTSPLSVTWTGRSPLTFTYAIDGINQPAVSGITSSPHVFQSLPGAHQYTLVSVANNDCSGTVSGTATVTLTSQSPVGHDTIFSAPGTALLRVNHTGDVYEWSDSSGTILHTGDTLITPSLTATTTYYVTNSSVVNVISKSVAMHDETSGDNPNRTDDAKGLPPAVCFLDFTANSSFLFDTLTCAVNSTGTGTGQVTVYITSYTTPGPFAGAETLVKDSINIPVTGSGLQKIKIPLHYSCTAGTNYHISYNAAGVLQTEMYWQFMQPTSFPITKDPELTIQQYGAPNTRYPGLFDWKIRVVSSTPACGRTPVTAYLCPTAVLSGSAVICNDGTSTTTLSVALTGNAPWTLTYAIDGINQTAITGIASSPYHFNSLTGAHTYTLVSVSNARSTGCANGASGTATITVNPDAPVGNNTTFLPGTAATLSVNNTGGTYNWFASATSNSIVHTGSTYTTPILSTTTTYYVQQVIGTDTSCTRTPVTAYLCPTAVLSGDAVICNDGTSTTTLSVALTGNAPWTLTYAIDGINQTAVTGIASSPYTFASQIGAHTYTLISVSNATSTGCANGASGTATVTVNPNAPVGNNVTFLPGTAATLSVNNTGGTYNWFASATSNSIVHTGSTYTTPILSTTTTYYVQQVIGTDTSCTRTPVTAYLCPTAVLSGSAVICNDGTSTTTLSVALTGDAPWTLTYAIDGINQTAVTGIASSPYTFASQTGAHTYTLISVSNATSTGCANGTSGTATITVKPDAPVGHDATFISPGSALLAVDDTGGTYNWYDASTGGNLLHTGTTYTTPTLTATTTYYVEQISGGQVSCNRTPVTAIVSVPAIGLFIPNLMTPNNDGKNDRFEILGLTNGSNLVVYNRWGNTVYQSNDYDNNWSAENLSSGVYFYELKVKNSESYKGWLEIIQ